MRDYKVKEPTTIVTAGKEKVLATATGTIWGYIIDQAGQRVPVRMSAMFVPGPGRNLFSSVKAKQSGASTILETGTPHLQVDRNTSIPLIRHPEDKGLCSPEVFLRAMGGTADTSFTSAMAPKTQASADAKRGKYTLKETQDFRATSGIAMVYTATVTPQQKRGIRAVRTESYDQERVHTNGRKEHACEGYCHGD